MKFLTKFFSIFDSMQAQMYKVNEIKNLLE